MPLLPVGKVRAQGLAFKTSVVMCRASLASKEGLRAEMMKSGGMRNRILVVDDEPIVCDSIRMLLTFDGHDVRTAHNAKEALEVFDPDEIDVLITDYAMPGMTGSKLATAIRQISPNLRIILVTAYAEMLDSWGADLSGVDCVVSKPFRLDDLRQALVGGVPAE